MAEESERRDPKYPPTPAEGETSPTSSASTIAMKMEMKQNQPQDTSLLRSLSPSSKSTGLTSESNSMSESEGSRSRRKQSRDEPREVTHVADVDFQAPEGCSVVGAKLYDLAEADPLLLRVDKAICPFGIEFEGLKGFTKVTAEDRAVARFELAGAADGTIVPVVRNPAGEFVALGCGTLTDGIVEVTFSALPPPALPASFAPDASSPPSADSTKLQIALKFFSYSLSALPTEPVVDTVTAVEDRQAPSGWRLEKGAEVPPEGVADGSASLLVVPDFAAHVGSMAAVVKAASRACTYAHVFAFDYDSLGGSINDAAMALKAQLEDFGFRFGEAEPDAVGSPSRSLGRSGGGGGGPKGEALVSEWTGWARGADGRPLRQIGEGATESERGEGSVRPRAALPPPKLDVVAHGLGGLVVRTMVELLGGESAVRHCVLAGVPNTGLPVRDVVTAAQYGVTLLALAANNLVREGAMESAILYGASYALMPQLPPLLVEAQGSSELLQQLPGPPTVENAREEPRVVYSIVSGDVCDPLVDQLLFYGRANDLAVTVEGARGRFSVRAPIVDSPPVPASHFSLLSDPRGVDAMARALGRAQHEREMRAADRRAAEVWDEEQRRGPDAVPVGLPTVGAFSPPLYAPPLVPRSPPRPFGSSVWPMRHF